MNDIYGYMNIGVVIGDRIFKEAMSDIGRHLSHQEVKLEAAPGMVPLENRFGSKETVLHRTSFASGGLKLPDFSLDD